MPVRIGSPTDLEGLVDTIANPAYATSVGLVRWSLTHGPAGEVLYDERHQQSPNEIYGRLRGWLKAFLP
jgi:cell division protein FtsA